MRAISKNKPTENAFICNKYVESLEGLMHSNKMNPLLPKLMLHGMILQYDNNILMSLTIFSLIRCLAGQIPNSKQEFFTKVHFISFKLKESRAIVIINMFPHTTSLRGFHLKWIQTKTFYRIGHHNSVHTQLVKNYNNPPPFPFFHVMCNPKHWHGMPNPFM